MPHVIHWAQLSLSPQYCTCQATSGHTEAEPTGTNCPSSRSVTPWHRRHAVNFAEGYAKATTSGTPRSSSRCESMRCCYCSSIRRTSTVRATGTDPLESLEASQVLHARCCVIGQPEPSRRGRRADDISPLIQKMSLIDWACLFSISSFTKQRPSEAWVFTA